MRPPPLLIYGKSGPKELCCVPLAYALRHKLPTYTLQCLARPKRDGVAKAGRAAPEHDGVAKAGRASTLQNLIATADPARIGILSDQREPKELSSGQNWKPKIILGTESKKRLIATLPKSRFESSHTKFMRYEKSNRNKMRPFRNSLVPRGDFSLGLTGATALCYLSGPSDPSSPPLRLYGGIE
jgi:hypothetical protein